MAFGIAFGATSEIEVPFQRIFDNPAGCAHQLKRSTKHTIFFAESNCSELRVYGGFYEPGKSSANTIFIKGNSSNLPAGRGGATAEDWQRIHPRPRASAYLHHSSLMNPEIN